MDYDKVFVVVNYPNEDVARMSFLKELTPDPKAAWQEVDKILRSRLDSKSADQQPLITIYTPKGTAPAELQAHRWQQSPPGVDIIRMGNLGLA